MNIFMEKKQHTDIKNKLVVAMGEGRIGSLRLADAKYYIYSGEAQRLYCIALGNLFNIL